MPSLGKYALLERCSDGETPRHGDTRVLGAGPAMGSGQVGKLPPRAARPHHPREGEHRRVSPLLLVTEDGTNSFS